MTVMLLERTVTPHSTSSPRAATIGTIGSSPKPPPAASSVAAYLGSSTDARTGSGARARGAQGGPGPSESAAAMRYYRLWIYACNVVLLGSAVGFAAAVSKTLLFSGDPRRQLIPGVPKALDPTALYAYLALATQLGLVQLLGCVAARRLSARLLHAYWLLLLALLCGDAVIGVAWVFRFERMRSELRPALKLRLHSDYAKEPRFSEQWDRLQREFSCCGVSGPKDFGGGRWPATCCGPAGNFSDEPCQPPHPRGCDETLARWLRRTADLLFVLGFCVIAFTKLCFLGILRYEIREMIQKIRLLREPPPPVAAAAVAPFAQQYPQLLSDGANGVNNGVNNGGIARRSTLTNASALPSGNATLLLHADDGGGGRHPLLSGNLQDGGADSDTNSHCALILEEITPTSTNHNSGTREKSNGNNNYEMRELNRRLLLSNGAGPGASANATQGRRT
ncbi:uncharacterized protein LOC105695641 [Orussus abietinus]|uniref:uncharacterized protein LOC105695641 n=1 Tax=Orussus abietinus TaxID=222816 RepID=UPI0006251BD6|nr:uncharacterized protein LOC105695641 [Orussus abietinus]XP_012272814.1 uncharacterized protein LOC105695641 [Orussus abietinus]